MSEAQDKIFFRNYTYVIVMLAIAMVVFFVLAQNFGSNDELNAERAATLEEKRANTVTEETAPMSEVSVHGEEDHSADAEGETVAAADAAGKSGEEVYNGMCVACHSVPGIGAPVVGNADDWTARLEQGMETLYDHAINGFTGPQGFMMPARGGGSFSDEEVKAAVDYMIENSK